MKMNIKIKIIGNETNKDNAFKIIEDNYIDKVICEVDEVYITSELDLINKLIRDNIDFKIMEIQ